MTAGPDAASGADGSRGRIRATLFTDPLSIDSWRHRPTVRRLGYVFRDVAWTPRAAVALPDRLDGERAREFAATAADAAEATGLPLADDAFAEGVPASWAACEALAAVRAVAPGRALAFHRRVQAEAFGGGRPPADARALGALAADVGVDADEVAAAVGSRRATAAVGADLERARATVAALDDLEVRGAPDRLPLGDRLLTDAPAGDEGTTPADDDGATPTDDDGATPMDDEGTTPMDDEGTTPTDDAEAAVFAPPVVRIDAGDETVVVDVRAGFDEFVDVFGRIDPDLGHLDHTADKLGRRAMRAYGMPKAAAEQLTHGQYGERIASFLADDGPAFTPEIAACLDLDPATVRDAARDLVLASDVTSTATGAWRRVPEE